MLGCVTVFTVSNTLI